MPLTQRSRSALYHGLVRLTDDDQAVEEMLSYFPARDVEEPVTKEFLRAEMADVRAEMADVRTEMADFRADMVRLHGELRQEFHVEIRSLSRRLMVAWFGSMTTFAAALIAAGALT